MHRRLPLLVLVVSLSGCAADAAPATSELRTLAEAARAGEERFGVPASLTLAVGWAETRWQLPDVGADDHHHGMASPVGIGGLRPWLAWDPVGVASERLGVSPDALADDPALSLLGTAAVLRERAEARGEVPPSNDPGAWVEILGDYAGLEGERVRRSYALDVLGWIERGVAAMGADGERTVLRSARVVVPQDAIGAAIGYGGAEYDLARWVPASSTNYSSRGGTAIDRIIIHTTQGSYAGAISWFQNPSANVSAHYVVRSSDGEITQMVQEADKAWHVGNWNSRSIGIEHEGFVADPGRWYTDAMYRSSAALVRHLCDKYGIPIDRDHIVGHVEAPGATHTDPGSGWDWGRYMDMVRGEPERPDYDATASDQEAPAEMTSGERAIAWVELRNDGARAWDLDRTRLGTAAPRDHASPLFDEVNWINDHRPTGPDHSDYATGQVGRFTFMITAPEVEEDTEITETFRLVQEEVAWFGPRVTLSILVHPRDGGGGCDDPSCTGEPPRGDGSVTAFGVAEPVYLGDHPAEGCAVTPSGSRSGPGWLLLGLAALGLALRRRG